MFRLPYALLPEELRKGRTGSTDSVLDRSEPLMAPNLRSTRDARPNNSRNRSRRHPTPQPVILARWDEECVEKGRSKTPAEIAPTRTAPGAGVGRNVLGSTLRVSARRGAGYGRPTESAPAILCSGRGASARSAECSTLQKNGGPAECESAGPRVGRSMRSSIETIVA